MVSTYKWSTSSLYVSARRTFSKRSISGDYRNWNTNVFAPYVQVSSDNEVSSSKVINKTGSKYFTYGFLNAKSVNGEEIPYWDGGRGAYNKGELDSDMETVKKNGGNIIISFGGADGRELATVIENESKLYKAYENVINYFKLTWIDLDIEGEMLKKSGANSRRNKVMKKLKENYPNLVVAYTLAASYSNGLEKEGRNLLKDAYKQGLQVDVVNVMAMDYDTVGEKDGKKKMGQYAIQTAEKAYEQIKEIGFKNTKIGITPMIGRNDSRNEIFTLDNAREVLEYAQSHNWIRLLSFWSINRDNGNGGNSSEVSDSYSSIKQDLFAFSNIFKEF
ncbi:glycoside hydrolase family 18 protein, partial [Piromyces sp. E2]